MSRVILLSNDDGIHAPGLKALYDALGPLGDVQLVAPAFEQSGPNATVRGSILLPQHRRDPAFLVYRNYRVFLAWNQSTYFAISLGTLADRVTNRGSSPVRGL